MPVIALAQILCAAPVTALFIMALIGLANPWAATLAIVVTIIPVIGFCLLWSRDLTILTAAIRDIDNPAPTPTILTVLGLELARLGRTLAARSAQIARERRAEGQILARLPDPLVVLRQDRSLSYQNPAAHSVFGGDLPALLRHPALRAALDQVLAKPSIDTQTADLTIAAPIARELRAAIVPIDPPLQDGGRAVIVLSDRTRERSIERSHVDFVANVSHELRTPLASLIGFTETLLGPAENDPPARKRFLTIMAEQGARMNRLIDDLLSLSRIETAEHQAPAGLVDLHTLLPRIVAGFEPRLAHGGTRLHVDIAPDTPPIVGDADQIAQIAQNLLDNAVKYGKPQGQVRLSLAVATPGDRWPARAGVLLSVADDGAGIPRAAIPRVTERFYRVDKGRSRAVGGTGLGLAIVKHIVNRHRGQMAIDSEEAVGTTVSVWLPLAMGIAPEAKSIGAP